MAEMTGGEATGDERPAENAPLVDVSGLDWKRLRELPDDALAVSLRRIFAELDSNAEPVAGFQSGI